MNHSITYLRNMAIVAIVLHHSLIAFFSCALVIPWVLSFYYSYIKRKYCNL